MPAPPLFFLDPREAVQRVREAFECTGEEAVRFLLDAWIAGTIVPRFLGPTPPAGYDPRDADWFSGEIVIRSRLQTSTIPIGGYDVFGEFDREQRGLSPREHRYPMRTVTNRYSFKIDRRQFDVLLTEAAAARAPEPDDADRKAADDHQASQSEKAKVRRRLKEFLEAEVKIAPPRARTKENWQLLARQELGNAVTKNLFDEVWRGADLPAAWRTPGRRT
jgi:hypothetical protein